MRRAAAGMRRINQPQPPARSHGPTPSSTDGPSRLHLPPHTNLKERLQERDTYTHGALAFHGDALRVAMRRFEPSARRTGAASHACCDV